MTSYGVLAAVLAAAVLHASWNALAKATPDRFGLFAKGAVASVGLGTVLCVLSPMPAAAALPWLIASVVMHVVYNVGLLAAYHLGDFNQTYPLARGVGPLVVALVAATFLHEPLPLLPSIGVVVIAAAIGVLGLTPWNKVRQARPALVAAGLTGLAIATYTLLDGVGVRRSGSPIGYTALLMGLHGALTLPAVLAVKRSRWAPSTSDKPASWYPSILTAALSMLAYGLVLWAQTRGALAAIAALRESSVVVAAILGAVLFREPLGRIRVAASFAVATGIVLLALA